MKNRRQFLQASSLALGVGTLAPQYLVQAAEHASGADDRVLVVVQLSGGNDGLNTIVPYADDVYRKRRPSLAIPATEVIKSNELTGFHPALRGFADLLERQQLAVVQGVGYANPNRSHFESMDIWHTCQLKKEQRTVGWLGRYLDQTSIDNSSDVPAIHFGGEQQPLALQARNVRVPSVKSLDEFKLQSSNDKFRETVSQLAATQRNAQRHVFHALRLRGKICASRVNRGRRGRTALHVRSASHRNHCALLLDTRRTRRQNLAHETSPRAFLRSTFAARSRKFFLRR